MNYKKTIAIFIILLVLLAGFFYYMQDLILDPVEENVLPKVISLQNCNYDTNSNSNSDNYKDCISEEYQQINKNMNEIPKNEIVDVKDIILKINNEIAKQEISVDTNGLFLIKLPKNAENCVSYGAIGVVMKPNYSLEIATTKHDFFVICTFENSKDILEITSKKQKIDDIINEFKKNYRK